MKTLYLVEFTVETSYYMSASRSQDTKYRRLVWSDDPTEIHGLLDAQYSTDEYSVYRHVSIDEITPALGSPV